MTDTTTAYRAVCDTCSPTHQDREWWSDSQLRRQESLARADADRHDENKSCGDAYVQEIEARENAAGHITEVSNGE